MAILGKTKVKEMLNDYPNLKSVLIEVSPKAKKLNNKLVYNTVAKWASISDVAKFLDISICGLLHRLNREIGKEEELYQQFPECISEKAELIEELRPAWMDEAKKVYIVDVRNRDDFFLPEIVKQAKQLGKEDVLTVVNSFDPIPLKNMLSEMDYEFYTEKVGPDEFHLTFHTTRLPEERVKNWHSYKESFEVVDVRGWEEDPFSAILKMAQDVPVGDGFRLIQYFEPTPLINMLIPLGFESVTEKVSGVEHHVFFCRIKKPTHQHEVGKDGRVPLVIQSATPVVYPIIMQLLKSPRLMEHIKVEELKVWQQTEKHMGWVVNGRADITFSAVVAAVKLFQNGADIKMTSIDIWDNFYVLTQGYEAESFKDLIGHVIYAPLFKNAPPYAITSYLMQKLGFNPDDFEFAFGKPFGRPEEIRDKFILGEADTVLLREPEASEALYGAGNDARVSLAFSNLWDKIHPELGNLPNAGVLFKGEFIRKYPELAEVFMEELETAIAWVNAHQKEAAAQAFEIMGQTQEAVELFLKRVNYDHRKVEDEDVQQKITKYLSVLNDKKVITLKHGIKDVREMMEWRL